MYQEQKRRYALGFIETTKGGWKYIGHKEVKQQLDEPDKVIKVKDLAPPDFELPKLDELINKKIFLIGFDLETSKLGKYAVIHTVAQGTFFTTSEIFIKQLVRIEKRLEDQGKVLGKGVIVEGKVKSKKGKLGDYYIFE